MSEQKIRQEIVTLTGCRDAIPYSFKTSDQRHDLFERVDALYRMLENKIIGATRLPRRQ